MGFLEIATLVITFLCKFVLPAIGGGAVVAAAVPDSPRRGGAAARGFSQVANAVGFNFGHAQNRP